MSVIPAYLVEDAAVLDAEDDQDTTRHVGLTQDATSFACLEADGAKFRRIYLADAQRIFSRIQHHMHKKTKKGYFPLKSCMSKGKNGCQICKAGFPKVQQRIKKSVLVCRGMAKRLGLPISGMQREIHLNWGI